jgi:hypothetical protein
MLKAKRLLFGALLSALPVNLRAAGRITAEVETKPGVKLSAEESRALSLSAAQILKHVDQARSAIGKKDFKAAGQNIDQGLVLVKIINQTVPTFKVETMIKAGTMTYVDNEDSKPAIVPVYEELQKVAVMAPIEAAKKAAQKDAAAAGVPVAVDVQLVHTRTDLNVALAEAGLRAAKDALQKEDGKTADSALAAIQTGVIFGYTKVDLPLEKVRENLMLAKALVDAGKAKEARAALEVTGDALEEYEKSAGQNRAKDAKGLRAEVEKLSKDIEANSAGASEKIMDWWDQVRKWIS